jgi:hypothetical protein
MPLSWKVATKLACVLPLAKEVWSPSPPYTILGRITGYLGAPGAIRIEAGSTAASPDLSGNYALHNCLAGHQPGAAKLAGAVFVLSNRLVNVGPDIIGIDFHSYRSNALVMERISSGVVRGLYAGEAGQTYQTYVSTTFPEWTIYSTNTAQSSGLFDFYDTNQVSGTARLFRVLRP